MDNKHLIKKRITIIDILLIGILASLTFLFIPAWLPFLRKAWQLLIVATLLIVFFRRKYINRQAFPFFMVYGIILYVNAVSGDEYIGSAQNAINELLVIFVSTSLALYCTNGANKVFIRIIVYLTLFSLLFELVASIWTLQTNPGVIRSLYSMTKEENDPSLMYDFYRNGLLDYSMAHAIPILIPPLVCFYKEGKIWMKATCAALTFACLYLTWISESSTALLLVVLMIVVGFVILDNTSRQKNLLIASILIFFSSILIINDNIMLDILDYLKIIVGEDSLQADKIEEINKAIYENQMTGDLDSRMVRYSKSIDLFFENIIWGSNIMPGRHSSFLDKLATLGLVGFISLISLFYSYTIYILKSLDKNRRIYYLECVLAAFLMLLFKGMWVWPIFFVLFIVSPCLLTMNRVK